MTQTIFLIATCISTDEHVYESSIWSLLAWIFCDQQIHDRCLKHILQINLTWQWSLYVLRSYNKVHVVPNQNCIPWRLCTYVCMYLWQNDLEYLAVHFEYVKRICIAFKLHQIRYSKQKLASWTYFSLELTGTCIYLTS